MRILPPWIFLFLPYGRETWTHAVRPWNTLARTHARYNLSRHNLLNLGFFNHNMYMKMKGNSNLFQWVASKVKVDGILPFWWKWSKNEKTLFWQKWSTKWCLIQLEPTEMQSMEKRNQSIKSLFALAAQLSGDEGEINSNVGIWSHGSRGSRINKCAHQGSCKSEEVAHPHPPCLWVNSTNYNYREAYLHV